MISLFTESFSLEELQNARREHLLDIFRSTITVTMQLTSAIFRTVTVYQFLKPGGSVYSLKERSIDFLVDLATIAIAPFNYIAKIIVAIVGVIFPKLFLLFPSFLTSTHKLQDSFIDSIYRYFKEPSAEKHLNYPGIAALQAEQGSQESYKECIFSIG